MKVELTMAVRDFSGSPYPKDSVLEARMASNGALEVVGASTCRCVSTSGLSC